MISGLVLKYLNGECFVIRRGYETARPVSSSFCLTVPWRLLVGRKKQSTQANNSAYDVLPFGEAKRPKPLNRGQRPHLSDWARDRWLTFRPMKARLDRIRCSTAPPSIGVRPSFRALVLLEQHRNHARIRHSHRREAVFSRPRAVRTA